MRRSSLEEFLVGILEARPGTLVTSPDEAESNLVAGLVPSDQLVELLNESVVSAWAMGAAIAGRPSVVVAYEGFASLVESLHVQYDRHLGLLGRGSQPAPTVLVLTSTAWMNVYSHQDPGAIAGLLARELANTSFVIPHRSEHARDAGTRTMIDGRAVTIAVVEKRPGAGVPEQPTARGRGWFVYDFGGTEGHFVLVTVGEPAFIEAVEAGRLAVRSGVPTRVVALEDPSLLPAIPVELTRVVFGSKTRAVLMVSTVRCGELRRTGDVPCKALFLRPVPDATGLAHLERCGMRGQQLVEQLHLLAAGTTSEVISR